MNREGNSAAIRWIVGLGSLGLALFFAVLSWLALSERETFWQLQMTKQADLQRLALHSTQRRQRDQARLLAESIAADSWAIELVRQAHALHHSGKPDRAAANAIRRQLYTRLAPRWRNLQSSHPFKLYIHLAPTSEVLLRVHQPEHVGDSPDAQRPMLLDLLQDEQGKAGLGLDAESLVMRAMTPLQVDGTLKPVTIGALEVTLGMLLDLQQLDQELDAGVALRLERSGQQPPTGEGRRSQTGASGNWRLEGYSRTQVRNWQAQRLLPAPAAGDTLKLLEDQGRTYLLTQVLLPDYRSAHTAGHSTPALALTWRDVSEQFARHRSDQQWLLGKWLLAWLGAEALLLLLLLSTRHASQTLISRHRDELQLKHQQSEQSRQLLAVIAQAQAAYITAQNQREAFDALLARILELTASQFGFIGEVREDQQGVPYLRTYSISNVAWDNASAALQAERSAQDLEWRNLDTLFGQVMRSGEALISNAPAQHPPSAGLPAGHPPLQAFAGLPIHAHGRLVGMLGLANRADGYPQALAEQLQPLLATLGQVIEALRRDVQVQEARAFLQAVLDSATGVSIIATDTSGVINLFNPGAELLLGYRAEEVIGQHSPMLFHQPEEVRARGRELSRELGREIHGFEVFVATVQNGEAQTRQWTYRRKDGEPRLVNLTLSAIRNEQGSIHGYLSIATDVSALQQATRALQKSESRFRGMVANLPGVVYRCSHDATWTMRFMGDEIEQLSGYPASDFIDNRVRSYASVIHPDDLANTSAIQAPIARQDVFELTYRLQHADGHSVWVREKGRGEYDSQGNLLWLNGFIWDISERKQIEDELKLSQQLFSSAFNTAPQGMALISPAGRWLAVNDELCRMFGYRRAELLAIDFQSITHPDDLAIDLANIEALLAGRTNGYQMEKRYLDCQGRIIWVLLSVSLVRDGQGRPVHFIAQIQDFSERVVAERAIREREHYLHTLLDNVLDAIITIDERGCIETFNRAAEKLFGYSLSQVVGHNVSLLMPEPERSAHDGYLARYQQTGETRLIGTVRELTGLRRNGDSFAMELAVSQISHQGQRRFIAVIRDISERKRVERMKNEFVSTVSHELRTPLTAIAGSLGLINAGVLGAVPANMQQMLTIAQDNSQHLSQLINDLLDMDKLVAGKMPIELSEQPLQPLLAQAIAQNQPYASQYRVQLQLLEPMPAIQVRVDSQRLTQVMANLLSNAAKFSPADQVVEVAVQHQGDQVRVSVRDHGPGIPEAFKASIFSKFSQADASDSRQKGGTGLGLAISKELIERMGGQIGFDSLAGRGATFWFELPLANGAER